MSIALPMLRDRDRVLIVEPGRLHPSVSFARASTATYMGPAGTIVTAAINAPRYEYTPAGVYLGLLIEEARTNALLNSATLSTQNVTVTAAARTLSFYGTGTVTLSGTFSGSLIGTGASNRVTLVFTPTAGTLTVTVSGSVTSAQLEIGAFATSYIPTTAAAVTRSADVAQIAGFSQIGMAGLSGMTVLAEMTATPNTTGFNSYMAIIQTLPFTGDTSAIIANAAAGSVSARPVGSASGLAGKTGMTPQTQIFKYGLALAASNSAGVVDGGTPVTNTTTATSPVNINNMVIGSGNGAYANTRIRRITMYGRRLPNSELQRLTT